MMLRRSLKRSDVEDSFVILDESSNNININITGTWNGDLV